MAALLLAAVDGTRGQAGVALTADPRENCQHILLRPSGFLDKGCGAITHILSQLYFEARALSEGSMIPPRRRRTK